MVFGCIQKSISDYIWAVTKTRWFMYIGGCYTTHIPHMETIIVHYKYIVYLLTKQHFIECHWWVLLPVTCQHHLAILEALPLAQWGDRLAVWTSSCLVKAKWPWMIQFVYIRAQQNGIVKLFWGWTYQLEIQVVTTFFEELHFWDQRIGLSLHTSGVSQRPPVSFWTILRRAFILRQNPKAI